MGLNQAVVAKGNLFKSLQIETVIIYSVVVINPFSNIIKYRHRLPGNI